MKAAVCLRCIENCEFCSMCLGCNPERTVAAHSNELFNVAEATCRSSLAGYSTHVISHKAVMNVMQASRTTANAFGSAPCCWQKLSSKAQIWNIECRTRYPWSCCCQAKWLLGTVYVCADTLWISFLAALALLACAVKAKHSTEYSALFICVVWQLS